MDESFGIPLLLMILGASVGSGLGLVAFEAGLVPNLEIALVSFTLVGSTTGFLAGMILRRRFVSPPVARASNLTATILVLILGLFFLFLGLLWHSSTDAYNGLLLVSAALWLLVSNRNSMFGLIAVVALGVVCLGASLVTRDHSWLIIAVLFGIAVFMGQYIDRHQRTHRESAGEP